MLTGLGGRRIAGEVAAGRVWRRSLATGDHIRAQNVAGVDVDGLVVEIHPTTIEVAAGRVDSVRPEHAADGLGGRTDPSTGRAGHGAEWRIGLKIAV